MNRELRIRRTGRRTMLSLVVFSLLGYSIPALPVYANQPVHAGDMAPDLVGRDPAGKKVKLSDYRDKIVIISFWASWCPSCRQEMAALANIQHSATRDKLVILAVNWKENSGKYHAILKALKDVDLTLLSDETGYFADQYGVKAIPHMIIIGRDGRIAAVHVGYGEGEIPSLVDEINGLWTQSPNQATALETTAGSPTANPP
jgi:peroxiredoxin